jgi:hypothetical protein
MSQDVVFDDSPRVEFLSEHLESLLDSVRYSSSCIYVVPFASSVMRVSQMIIWTSTLTQHFQC